MAATVTFFNHGHEGTALGSFAWGTDTFKLSLHTSTYAPDIDLDEFFDDTSNELPTAGGYTAGGETIAGVVVTQNDTTDLAEIDFTNPEINPATFTTRYGVLRKDSGVASTSPLLLYIDFGSDQSPSAQPFRIELDPVGLYTISQG